ncbi:MAG: BatD family protein [Chthoniobacterales bacterium]
MSPKKFTNKVSAILLLTAFFSGFFSLCAQPSAAPTGVIAELSSSSTQVRHPIQLQVTLTGISNGEVPPSISVEGLDIRLYDRRQSVTINNLVMTSQLMYIYQVIPYQEGTFTIPALDVRAGGKQYRTKPLSLTVSAIAQSSPVSTSSAPGSRQGEKQELAFAKFELEKKECYVGETVPVKVVVSINGRLRPRFTQVSLLSGDGFTHPAPEEPEHSTTDVNDVWTFNSFLTPVKAGVLNIKPAEFHCIVQNGGANSAEDFFNQLFNQGGGGLAQNIVISSNPVSLNVKPLPQEGKPANFNGAIGEFSLDSTASPKKVGPGEPVTMRIVLSGKGNFDALTPPTLTNADAWRSYTPKETLVPLDANGLSKKTFEYLLIAKEATNITPGIEFSYFNPDKHRYVTLTQPGIPVQAASPQTSPETSSVSATPTASASASPSIAAPKSSALPIESRESQTTQSFNNPLQNKMFLWMQGVAFILLIAFIALVTVKKINSSEKTRRRELQKLAEGKLHRLSGEITDRRSFYHEAIACLQNETSARKSAKLSEAMLDDILLTLASDPDVAAEIRRIFEANDAFTYGFAGRDAGDITPMEREQVIDTLKKIINSNVS